MDHSDHDAVKRHAFDLCNQFLGQNWCPDLDSFQFKSLTGGLTNILYTCKRAIDKDGPTYIIRYFGGGKINNINEENLVAAILGERGLGPKIYRVFRIF